MLNIENILANTKRGLLIYYYILSEKFPRKDIKRLMSQGHLLPNPFVPGGRLQLQLEDGIYCHRDVNFPDFKGTAIDFAGLYFQAATRNELYYLINQSFRLRLRIPAEIIADQIVRSEDQRQYPKISFFQPPITNTCPKETVNLRTLFERIKGPDYQKQTETLRALEDPKEARKYKARHFPYVTFAGCFEKRDDKHLLTPSGLLVIDLDDVQELPAVREALKAELIFETELLFVSPSGRGLKWVTSYPHQDVTHQEHFRQVCSYLEAIYGLKPDESGKDTSRACFICADPEAVLGRKYLFWRG